MYLSWSGLATVCGPSQARRSLVSDKPVHGLSVFKGAGSPSFLQHDRAPQPAPCWHDRGRESVADNQQFRCQNIVQWAVIIAQPLFAIVFSVQAVPKMKFPAFSRVKRLTGLGTR